MHVSIHLHPYASMDLSLHRYDLIHLSLHLHPYA
jgi:hypothetical protein